MSGIGILRGVLTGGPDDDCTVSRYGRFDLAFANLRYYLSNAYIASPVFVWGGWSGDPGNNGSLERGTATLPFNTVYEATFAVRAGDTVRIRRPARVTTDETGRTIWIGDISPFSLELDSIVETDPYDRTDTFELR